MYRVLSISWNPYINRLEKTRIILLWENETLLMISRLRSDREPDDPKPIVKIKTRPDKKRQQEDDRHQPMAHFHPVPKHKSQKKPALPPRHMAHLKPLRSNQDMDSIRESPATGKDHEKIYKEPAEALTFFLKR